ncbi:hypothetical protein HMPREF0602_1882 [Neisseria meningitidis ATCC 13091]|nr:hypothetical protein HMPREF0602_1882 [Neisseria meningitidis ATCC 13091]
MWFLFKIPNLATFVMMKKVLLMKYGVFFAAATALLLSACGYKGDLYLPKEGDKARFGVIQTGLQLQSKPQSAPQTQK